MSPKLKRAKFQRLIKEFLDGVAKEDLAQGTRAAVRSQEELIRISKETIVEVQRYHLQALDIDAAPPQIVQRTQIVAMNGGRRVYDKSMLLVLVQVVFDLSEAIKMTRR